MFASYRLSRAKRRGIVLVVILGMLGLLALIGVTFATFSTQAQSSARQFAQANGVTKPEQLMDFALSQLIDDTADPSSVLRGHSLKRDMYGNDAQYNGALLGGKPDGSGAILFTDVTQVPANGGTVYAGLLRCVTNISTTEYTSYSYDNGDRTTATAGNALAPGGMNFFRRWYVRFPSGTASLKLGKPAAAATFLVGETHEILWDDFTDNSGYRVFYIRPPYENIKAFNPAQPGINARTMISGYTSPQNVNISVSTLPSQTYDLTNEPNGAKLGVPLNTAMALDGRYLRAFNGAGIGTLPRDVDALPANSTTLLPRSIPEFANFRYNGNLLLNSLIVPGNGGTASFLPTVGVPEFPGDYNASNQLLHYAMPGMDEDYDACDLENWFLAIQTADGQVPVPSFHRPGIISRNPDPTLAAADNDWTRSITNLPNNPTNDDRLKAVRAMSRILRPRAVDGHSPISFPNLIPDASGKITYDVDNDGDGTSDSVWLDLGYPPQRSPEGQLYKPLFAFMVIGLNGRLPLNTAGNLQDRDSKERPTFSHADHLGNSPSEIDIRYALQNAYDPNVGGNPFVTPFASSYSQVDNAGVSAAGDTPVPVALTQARNLLAGTRMPDPAYDPNNANTSPISNYDINAVRVNNRLVLLPNNMGDAADLSASGSVYVNTAPVAGKWAEEDNVPRVLPVFTTNTTPAAVIGDPYTLAYPNAIRPGHSATSYTNPAPDARDDNYNVYDAFPVFAPAASPPSLPENADFYDLSGSISLPVERIRRFVNPIDLSGDGLVVTFAPTGPGSRGRAGRPKNLGADSFGRVGFFHYFRPPGLPLATFGAGEITNPTQPAAIGHLPKFLIAGAPYDARSNNLYHGYVSAIAPSVPSVAGNPFTSALAFAGMPTDMPPIPTGQIGTPVSGTVAPTFTATINSSVDASGNPKTAVGYTNPAVTFISPGLNEADEMDHYAASRLDAPFSASDLEWLYRAQDVDGASLQSRLAYLAPISFNNPKDGLRRRRLFALDTFEMNNFVYANDNPGGAFSKNSRFAQTASASLVNLAASTPSVAHRDKRVNLNFPLPVSNSPVEPIRQKWVRETYQLLKTILPPRAVDTPEELAQLSQFVVNMVDFRDPDCTATRFVNTDLAIVPGANALTPPSLVYAGALPASGVPYDVTIDHGSPNATVPGQVPAANYVIQYGLEYPPVAINEVLAVRFQTNVNNPTADPPAGPPATDPNFTTAMYVELINTLTRDSLTTTPDSSDLDLAGWDVVIMPDDSTGRPDPITGQIPDLVPLPGTPNIVAYTLTGGGVQPSIAVPGAAPATLATPIPAINPLVTPNSPTYYVIGGLSTPAPPGVPISPALTPPTVASSDLADRLKTLPEDTYYWLYLRRPPNPFDPTYNTAAPNDNRVVVDCFRFVYTTSKGRAHNEMSGNATQGVAPTGDLMFSLQRMQPFRGGHAVPPLAGVSGSFVTTAYGYSEQTSVAPASTNFGSYKAGSATVNTTTAISHTLGLVNNPRDTAWDYFPFNDRDFTSVVEVLTVPSCPPGLFTKQFAEAAPPIAGTTPIVGTVTGAGTFGPLRPNLWAAGASATPPSPWNVVGYTPTPLNAVQAPHPFPYLNDEFFYTAANEDPTKVDTSPGAVNKHWWPEASGTPPTPYRSLVTVSPTNPVGSYIGGPGGAGWHKMLDFFEVPSPVFGAIGNVALGTNYDWARQDLKPGLLNPNLIVDEEVFLGLMGETLYGEINKPNSGVLNSLAASTTPIVPTMVDDNGSPFVLDSTTGNVALDANNNPAYTGFRMASIGVVDQLPNALFTNLMKASFSDFLKLRHGGSGFAFAFGSGGTGQYGWLRSATNKTTTPVASERPYRSLSFPDINFTVFRPASLSPSANTTPSTVTNTATNPPTPTNWANFADGLFPAYPATNDAVIGSTPLFTAPMVYVQDPGVKNPYLFTRANPVQPPPIPPRRLFQIPDFWGHQTGTGPGDTPSHLVPPSNASSAYNHDAANNTNATGDPAVNNQILSPRYDGAVNTGYAAPFSGGNVLDIDRIDLTALISTTSTPPTVYLGGGNYTAAGVVIPGPADQRDHPYFRTEWLQKVTNLTTPRTHQYAVWITVGLFEVTRQGDPMLAATRPDLAYDLLGLELGKLDGKNVRSRGFFLVDRTRAVGFNPYLPGDYRDCVVYRQIIE